MSLYSEHLGDKLQVNILHPQAKPCACQPEVKVEALQAMEHKEQAGSRSSHQGQHLFQGCVTLGHKLAQGSWGGAQG